MLKYIVNIIDIVIGRSKPIAQTTARLLKLTTSLVKVSFNFQTLIFQMCLYFSLRKNMRNFCSAKAPFIVFNKNITAKCFSHFFQQKISVHLVTVKKLLTSYLLTSSLSLRCFEQMAPDQTAFYKSKLSFYMITIPIT